MKSIAMKAGWSLVVFGGLALGSAAAAQDQNASAKPAERFVSVEPNVKLEVLDWGGNGRPLVFLSGLGDTAHVYDAFAPRFTARYHVYGITRRGFGDSSKPEPTDANYSADRLGEDVVAVIDALHLDHPVLAGHSIAGEELSWVGNHDPKKVAGLIYLDAGDYYGFYDQARGNSWIDMLQVKRRLDALRAGAVYDNAYREGLEESVAQLDKDLLLEEKRIAALPTMPAPPAPPAIPLVVLFGEEKFTKVETPAIDIVACPHDMAWMFRGPLQHDAAGQAAIKADDLQRCVAQSTAFGAAMPWVPVVRIPNANHHVFVSNPDVVARAINDFLAKLPAS
ncbi:MAG: alpha/beta hydrolase [Acidobacteriaceae bacterium]